MKSFYSFLKIAPVAVSLLIAGCVATPEQSEYADITFRHLAPIKLNVGEIKVVNEFKPTLKAPHIEHELPVKIDQSVQRWAADRLQAVGNSSAYAVLTIKDASAVEKTLKKKTGVTGFFTNDQSELYEFRVSAELKIVDVNGSTGFVAADASRTKSVDEEITLNDRERLYYRQTEVLLQDFDVEMEKNIRDFLGSFIR
ncbi:MAG: hypothetical protein JKY12_07645 [Sneathiella sp.]|nr:hypothetical protein [Sneathiella sp.]